MGCIYFGNGICSETKTHPDPRYSLKYCSKSQEHYEKCAFFNLKRWKDKAHFDLRLVESDKYVGLKNLTRSQILRGILRRIILKVEKCVKCKSLQRYGKKGLCHIHSVYVQKTAYALQEIHGFNNTDPLKFEMGIEGPFSREVDLYLKGQDFITEWSASKVDAYGVLGRGGLEEHEEAIFYKLINRYLNMPKKQLEILTTTHYEITRKGQNDWVIDSLKEKYKNIEDYEKEVKILREPLLETLKSISSTFDPIEPLAVGSSGILILVRDKSFPGRNGALRVLKFPRPRGGEFKLANLRIIQDEKDRLCSLNHDRIVKVITAGETSYGNLRLPWYIMEYIGPSLNLEEFLGKKRSISLSLLVNILIDVASALHYLHQNEIIHCDIKAQNILVREDETPVAMITDIGYAHTKKGDKKDVINVRFSLQNAHPFLCKNITRASDPSAVTTQLTREQLHVNFDLYAFGKTLEHVWQSITKELKENGISPEDYFGKYETEYFKLIIARLLATGAEPSIDGGNQLPMLEDYAPGLPKEVLVDELAYKSSLEVLEDLLKFSGRIHLESFVPELNPFYSKVINLGAKETKLILTERVKKIINTKAFNRLASIRQLGLICYVYPGATHYRIEHLLGAYAQTCEYVRALWYNPHSPLFKSIMRKEDILAVLLASLLHDVGCYPLAHDLEDCDEWGSSINHKLIACRVIDENFREIISRDWGVDPEYVKNLIIGKQDSFRAKILHSIIDGPIDSDTLDFLLRDGMHLGLPYAQCIDKEWFLRNLTIAYGPNLGKNAALAVTDKGRVSAEAIAFARYMMYSVAYWHHTVRAIKAMIRYAVGRLANGKSYDPEEHYLRFIANSDNKILDPQIAESIAVRKELAPTDVQQLLWIRERVDDEGKKMVDMLLQRDLFKRIIVIDSSRSDTENLYKFFTRATDRQIEQVRERLEATLRDWISTHHKIECENLKPLVLVDVPRINMPFQTLYYVSELGTTPLSHSSIVWKELAERFSQSIGKVRIFVHPKIAPLIRQFLSRDTLLEMLTTIVESIDTYRR